MRIKYSGFTLIELVVVIAIIGVLAAMLIPSLTGYVRKSRKSSDLAAAKVIYQDSISVITENEEAWDALVNIYNKNQKVEKWSATDPETHESYKLVAVARMSGNKNYSREYTWTCPYPDDGEIFAKALTRFQNFDAEKSASDEKINIPLKLNADIPGTRKGKIDFWTVCYRLDKDEIEVWGSCSIYNASSTSKGYLVYRLWPDPDPAYK